MSTDAANSITDILSQRLYLLDEGGQGVSPLRSGLQVFAIRTDDQTEGIEDGDYVQEVPGRGKGLSTDPKRTAWRNDEEGVTMPPQTLESPAGTALRPTAKETEASRSQLCTETHRTAEGAISLKR